MAFCSNCGGRITGRFCASCGMAAEDQAPSPGAVLAPPARQNHGVPALLSFFIPGLGQLVKGQVGAGILIFVLTGAAVLSMAITIGFVAAPALWIWQIYDAYTKEV